MLGWAFESADGAALDKSVLVFLARRLERKSHLFGERGGGPETWLCQFEFVFLIFFIDGNRERQVSRSLLERRFRYQARLGMRPFRGWRWQLDLGLGLLTGVKGLVTAQMLFE